MHTSSFVVIIIIITIINASRKDVSQVASESGKPAAR